MFGIQFSLSGNCKQYYNQHSVLLLKNTSVVGYVILILIKWFLQCVFLFTEILHSKL